MPICRYVAERSPNWFKTLKEYFDSTPSAAVGEVISIFLFCIVWVLSMLELCIVSISILFYL